MSTTSRKFEISVMNVLFCLFVIFIHTSSAAMSTADKNSWQTALLLPVWKNCAVAVYGFIFLAGIKLSFGLEKPFSYRLYLFGRIFRVLIPYFVAAAVYYVYFINRGYFKFNMGYFAQTLVTGDLVGHFYFVIIIMQFYLLAPLWRAFAKRLESAERVIAALLTALFISQLFGQYLTDFIFLFNKTNIFKYSDRIFTTYLFYFIAGLAVGRHYERVKSAAVANFKPLFVLFVFAASNNALLAWINFTGREFVYWLETAHSFYVIIAIMFFFSAAVRYGTHLSNIKLLGYIDRSSYSIYLWHPLALFISEQLISSAGGLSLFGTFAVRIVFGYFVTIPICVSVSLAYGKIKEILKKKVPAG